MAKLCALCGFSSDDPSIFAQHARDAHGLGLPPRDTQPAWAIGIPVLAVGGFLLYALATLFVSAFCGDGRAGEPNCVRDVNAPILVTLALVVACVVASGRRQLVAASLSAVGAALFAVFHWMVLM